MVPPPLHVCNGLARPADESMLAWDIETTGDNENIDFAGHSLRIGHNYSICLLKILCSCVLYDAEHVLFPISKFLGLELIQNFFKGTVF